MLKASSLKIDTRSRKKGVYQFDFSPSAEALDLDPSVFRDIVVTGSVSIASSGTVVRFTASAVAILECDRTLVDFDQPISGDFDGLVADATDYDESVSGKDRQESGEKLAGANPVDSLQSGDADLVPMFEGVIVLDDVVRDTLMLAVPMRKVSPEAAALEMKLEYGKEEEEEIDPRWEALRRLGNDPI